MVLIVFMYGSSIFAHGVQEIIQMDLKTSKMILRDKHMRAKVSDFSLSKLAVDRAVHVSGIWSMAHNMHQTVIENRGLRCASDSTSGCLQAATVQSSIFARTYRLMAHTGKHSNLGNGWLWMKCFSTASVTILGEKKAQSTELEDKAKEVPELKTERHKKKLNIDKLEGIARLKLAEAAMLQLKANKA
ncbi:hypothetical protein IGI04_013569 [Brassica rapa subsp. trilocularis]|uniref:Oberon coiled-coil region domain-containing protein n=1 Tax=Brassica rapa subsp. trilocularis TaxID=1813537 RepID=A0ABQ7N975_BRACM|nr:hypothetical protein IGI04_013569 [Brassica rapa subsp. trilocularis]